MTYQLSLFDSIPKSTQDDNTKLKILLWNIQNPSVERARSQIEWIIKMNPDILILTEVKDSNGFNMIRSQLDSYGFKFIYNKSNLYLTAIAIKNINYKEKEISLGLEQQRVRFVELDTFMGRVGLIGAYVPTNSRKPEGLLIKKQFQDSFITEVKNILINKDENLKLIIAGDINILEPNHYPKYPQFDRWYYFYNFFVQSGLIDIFKFLNPNKNVYSWEGQGQSQRLDYIFISRDIVKYVVTSEYIHFPRANRLSDHSAVMVVLGNKE